MTKVSVLSGAARVWARAGHNGRLCPEKCIILRNPHQITMGSGPCWQKVVYWASVPPSPRQDGRPDPLRLCPGGPTLASLGPWSPPPGPALHLPSLLLLGTGGPGLWAPGVSDSTGVGPLVHRMLVREWGPSTQLSTGVGGPSAYYSTGGGALRHLGSTLAGSSGCPGSTLAGLRVLGWAVWGFWPSAARTLSSDKHVRRLVVLGPVGPSTARPPYMFVLELTLAAQCLRV